MSDTRDAIESIAIERGDRGVDRSYIKLESELECHLLRYLFWDVTQPIFCGQHGDRELSKVWTQLQHNVLLEGCGEEQLRQLHLGARLELYDVS